MSKVYKYITKPQTQNDASKALEYLTKFLSYSQFRAMRRIFWTEEKQSIFDKCVEMADRIQNMPVVWEQDGKGNQATVYLHYFKGSMDWFITEITQKTGPLRAYGYANLGHESGEMCYISIDELIQNNIELDLHFTPKTLKEILEN